MSNNYLEYHVLLDVSVSYTEQSLPELHDLFPPYLSTL